MADPSFTTTEAISEVGGMRTRDGARPTPTAVRLRAAGHPISAGISL